MLGSNEKFLSVMCDKWKFSGDFDVPMFIFSL